MPTMELFFYGFTLWLGAYLIARNSQNITVQLTGWGLLAYALALAIQIIFDQFILLILLVPALLWIGAALHLLPQESQPRALLIRLWLVTAIPLAILTLINPWFAAIIILALAGCAGMIAKLALGSHSPFKNTFALLAVVALFVTLSLGLLILPLGWISLSWSMVLLGLDLIFLGITITVWDAFDEGQTIRAHLARSFVSALYYAGALALIARLFSTEISLILLLITFGILTQTFSDAIQSTLDRLTLSQKTIRERQTLRQTADALPLLESALPDLTNDEQFTRLTRRALSNLGDLPRLAKSPLVNLPGIEGSNPMDRAHALRSLLIKSIQRLKPQSDARFGTTDEWRYYNSLHFPYVLGLKPYTRRLDVNSLDESSRAALDWFQASVPERTLHNWQNAAAQLIAEDLLAVTGSGFRGLGSPQSISWAEKENLK
jgi:hypothetical protein